MRVVWAISTVPGFGTFSPLQYCMLLASVSSFKMYHPNETTVLYTSRHYYNKLESIKALDLWDEVHVLDFTGMCSVTEASWDYAKVEALNLEKEKVLYIDYDIIFWNEVLSKLDLRKQWIYMEEPLTLKGVYLTKAQLRRYGSKLQYGRVAINTGILYLDLEIVRNWKKIYSQELPLILNGRKEPKLHYPVTLSVGQGGLGKLLENIDYQDFVSCVPSSDYVHYMGIPKSTPENPVYQEMLEFFTLKFPTIVQQVSTLPYKQLV